MVILLVVLSGCGEKKKAEGSGSAVSITPKAAPVAPKVVVEEKTLAEYIKNKRVYIGVGAETGFGQFYGNGSWQTGSIVDGVATTSGEPDQKGRYEVNELTATLISEDGGEDLLDFSSPEPVANDKLTITKDDGSQQVVTIIKIEEAGIVQVESVPSKGGAGAGDVEDLLGAIITGDLQALEAFLESGGDINTREPDKERNTLMHIAVLFGKEESVKLLAKSGADLDLKNTNGTTPLMSAGFLGKRDLVKILLENGASQDVKDNGGMTALDVAAMSWEDAKGIVDFLNLAIFVPLGSPLDPNEVRAGREDCVDILRDAKK